MRQIKIPGFTTCNVTTARKLWSDPSVRIVMVPNKVNDYHVFGGWSLGYEPSAEARSEPFDVIHNSFCSYLDSELGTYAKFIYARI